MTQLGDGAMPVVHTVELLDWAWRAAAGRAGRGSRSRECYRLVKLT